MRTFAPDDPLQHKLHGVAVYNPDLLSEEELKALFIARQELLARLVEGLQAERPAHTLVVGVRGMGKTTLLRRLKYSIQDEPALCERWLPLVFPEEQYNVTRLSDFYLNCLDALSDTLEALGDRNHMQEVDRFIEELEGESDDTIAKAAREGLQEMSKRLERGFVLLVDNVERILDDLTDSEGWSFRELLSEEDGIVLIGASTQAVESSYEYDKPFYDFFDIRELRGLSAEDTERVLRTLAETTHNPQVAKWIDDDPARLKTLNILSDGNPRTVVLLFQLLVQGVEGDVRSDLERLLDMCTPLYKARFEELPAQAQQILDALAMIWEPATAAQVAEKTRLDVTKASSQLSRLVRQGLVQQVPLPPGKRTGFMIAERFFNIWYLMRASRRVRRRLLWLAQFLKMFYTEPELRERAQAYLQSDSADSVSALRHAEYGFVALAHAVSDTEHSSAIEYRAIALLNSAKETRERISELLDLEGDDQELKPVAERLRLMSEARDCVFGCSSESWPEELDREHFWHLFGGSLSISIQDKHTYAAVFEDRGADVIRDACEILTNEHRKWADMFFKGLDGKLLDAFYDAVASGYLDGPADTASAPIAAEALAIPDLPTIVEFWAAETGSNKSEEAYRGFIAIAPESTVAWNGLGNLLKDRLARYQEAEQAYRQAIEIDPQVASPWNNLGQLLHYRLARYEEAEQAYRQAIELDPQVASPWNGLGNLLKNHLARYQEAEQAYRQAIEIDPHSSTGLNGLAWFLYERGGERLEEAEEFGKQAFDLQPESPYVAHTYATILVRRGRWFAAVEPARRFLETTDTDFFERTWPDIVTFFREAARSGHAEDAVKLLRECGRDEQWRPLVEALMAVAEGSTDRLIRLAPEMRAPATELYDQFLGDSLTVPESLRSNTE